MLYCFQKAQMSKRSAAALPSEEDSRKKIKKRGWNFECSRNCLRVQDGAGHSHGISLDVGGVDLISLADQWLHRRPQLVPPARMTLSFHGRPQLVPPARMTTASGVARTSCRSMREALTVVILRMSFERAASKWSAWVSIGVLLNGWLGVGHIGCAYSSSLDETNLMSSSNIAAAMKRLWR